MHNLFTTKRLCRAGIIAALYVALTYVFAPFAFGPLQIRPAEALCILAVVYPESIPALYVGCMLSNLASPYFVYDVFIGSLSTLLGAFGSYAMGKAFKKAWLQILLGGIFPVIFNALLIPLIIVFLCGGGAGYPSLTTAYFAYAGSIALTEAVWIYALGAPLYLTVSRLRKKSVGIFCD